MVAPFPSGVFHIGTGNLILQLFSIFQASFKWFVLKIKINVPLTLDVTYSKNSNLVRFLSSSSSSSLFINLKKFHIKIITKKENWRV